MNRLIDRRTFVASAAGSSLAIPLGLSLSAPASAQPDEQNPLGSTSPFPPGFPSHEPALAREVVGKSHFDLEAVTAMVKARPALARAVWDWGFGDWETALGAASHVGRRDIAELLIAHGARPDIFTFAMFGQLEAIKAIIQANPAIQRLHGPHGITLLAHAEAGGDEARPVLEYLQSLGDADPAQTDLPLDPALRAAILGDYVYQLEGESARGDAAPSCAIVEQRDKKLAFKHEPDGSRRVLFHQGEGCFHPAGTPHVHIAFQEGALLITDGPITIRAAKAK
jgi:hypothetical protein